MLLPESTPRPANTVKEVGPWRCISPLLSFSSSDEDWTMLVCFSCGRPGHGINRCPQRDETFPCLLPGWSVENRDGQYMAVSSKTTPGRLQSGNDD